MFLLESTTPNAEPDLVFSATNLVNASVCEYRTLRVLDEKLGRSTKPEFDVDEMLERTAQLGDVHERRILDRFLAEHGEWDPTRGTGVYDVVPAAGMERSLLLQKHSESVEALRSGADVVFQAAFFDGQFHGRSDFLVKIDGAYAVWDTKLARHAKVGALLQLAAYGDQMLKAGIEPAPLVTLVLGNEQHSDHRLADLLPVYRERRDRFLALVGDHRAQPDPVMWGGNSYAACGRCEYCQLMVEETRDLLLVGRMSTTRRAKLHQENIRTIDELAALDPAAEDESLRPLIDQARMQTGVADVDGSVEYRNKHGETQTLSYRVLEENSLANLPAPDEGDIFFDFEGDPLWQDPLTGRWGIEYLFGVVENPPSPDAEPPFVPFWAHNRAEERQAFASFLYYVAERRRRYPNLHIYHYAAYEKSALRNLSLIHLIGEESVDTLLREGVLVDLYETVRTSLRISDRSYSIKKLEPLYMGDNLRSGDVTDAGASVVAYAQYCEARDSGNTEKAAEILAGISDYNQYDCLSTLELRNWLLGLASARNIALAQPREPKVDKSEPPSPEEQLLLDHVTSLPTNRALTKDEHAIAMVAAAVGYHRREDKQYWWEHFDRLGSPLEDWSDTRDVFAVRRATVLEDWTKPNARSNHVRVLDLCGIASEGSEFKPGSTWFRMYGEPLPEGLEPFDGKVGGREGWFGTEVTDTYADRDGEHLVIREKLKRGGEAYEQTPMALTPDRPISTKSIRAALAELAQQVGASLPGLPRNPGLDILRRANPNLTGGASLPELLDHDYVSAITAAVRLLDRSYLAVQGPPGTGKTYVGSHVVAALVAAGWKVGVVAQSHAVVENMLRAALKAGVPPHQVAKKTDDPDAPWTYKTDDDVASLLDGADGVLVGGTAWTMTGSKVPPSSLDLLVIDEAGQFSLANTLAVSRAAKRLLLLGDPQQLPQVTQANHPEPVDESALGWLSQGDATLRPERGYFLADSWRMHPELCRAVSRLAYDDKLESAVIATKRVLDGVPAGVECVLVDHTGNKSASSEEAEEVVRQVQQHVGLRWDDASAEPRPLTDADVLVVAAYNAQVQLIRRKLKDAGLTGTRVGTVDKFQGQEAPVVIVSMACSAASEAPRGIQFLLNRNRINVAISRGQWRAVIVRSPELTQHMPARPEQLEELGAFIGLCSSSEGAQV
ncbi:TM0106 family RecB-like putative nuclease [Arthrobacter tecti]